MSSSRMLLPRNLSQRVWWFWRRADCHPNAIVKRQYSGKNHYFAAQKAAREFGVEPHQLESELVSIPPQKPAGSKHRPWAWLGDTDATKRKLNAKKKRKKKKR